MHSVTQHHCTSLHNFRFQSKAIIPVVEVEAAEPPREITEDEAKFSAYQTLRKARAHKRLHKVRNTSVGPHTVSTLSVTGQPNAFGAPFIHLVLSFPVPLVEGQEEGRRGEERPEEEVSNLTPARPSVVLQLNLNLVARFRLCGEPLDPE